MMFLPSNDVGASTHRHSPRTANGALTSALLCGMFTLGILVATTGCSTPLKPSSLALVVIENHTDHVWRVALRPMGEQQNSDIIPGDAWLAIEPRATRRVEIPEGSYRVWRDLIIDDATDSSSADCIILNFAGGRTYLWPLATLASTGNQIP